MSVGEMSSAFASFRIVLGRKDVNPFSARYIVLSLTPEISAKSFRARALDSRSRLKRPFMFSTPSQHFRTILSRSKPIHR